MGLPDKAHGCPVLLPRFQLRLQAAQGDQAQHPGSQIALVGTALQPQPQGIGHVQVTAVGSIPEVVDLGQLLLRLGPLPGPEQGEDAEDAAANRRQGDHHPDDVHGCQGLVRRFGVVAALKGGIFYRLKAALLHPLGLEQAGLELDHGRQILAAL